MDYESRNRVATDSSPADGPLKGGRSSGCLWLVVIMFALSLVSILVSRATLNLQALQEGEGLYTDPAGTFVATFPDARRVCAAKAVRIPLPQGDSLTMRRIGINSATGAVRTFMVTVYEGLNSRIRNGRTDQEIAEDTLGGVLSPPGTTDGTMAWHTRNGRHVLRGAGRASILEMAAALKDEMLSAGVPIPEGATEGSHWLIAESCVCGNRVFCIMVAGQDRQPRANLENDPRVEKFFASFRALE